MSLSHSTGPRLRQGNCDSPRFRDRGSAAYASPNTVFLVKLCLYLIVCWSVRHFNPFTLSFFHSFPQREKSVRGGKGEGYCRLLQKLTLQEGKIKLDMFEMKGEGGRELIGGTRQR